MNRAAISGGERRIIGNTDACFTHFMNQSPGLGAAQLLAEFYMRGNEGEQESKKIIYVTNALRWWSGDLPYRGETLLRLRCFLHLTGRYDVAEFRSLNGDAQTLALIVAFRLDRPKKLEQELGYHVAAEEPQAQSLWRVLIQGGGYTPSVEKNMKAINKAKRAQLNRALEQWRERIGDYYDETSTASTLPAPAPEPAVSSEVIAAFVRLTGATTALALAVGKDPATARAAVAAMRGGADLAELIAVLEALKNPS